MPVTYGRCEELRVNVVNFPPPLLLPSHTHPCSNDASEMLWHSGPVVERLSSRELATKSGTVYRLEGPLDHAALGINDRKITQSFKNGFPKNWLQLIEKHAMGGKE